MTRLFRRGSKGRATTEPSGDDAIEGSAQRVVDRLGQEVHAVGEERFVDGGLWDRRAWIGCLQGILRGLGTLAEGIAVGVEREGQECRRGQETVWQDGGGIFFGAR